MTGCKHAPWLSQIIRWSQHYRSYVQVSLATPQSLCRERPQWSRRAPQTVCGYVIGRFIPREWNEPARCRCGPYRQRYRQWCKDVPVERWVRWGDREMTPICYTPRRWRPSIVCHEPSRRDPDGDDGQCREAYGSLEYVRSYGAYVRWIGGPQTQTQEHPHINGILLNATNDKFVELIMGGILGDVP